MNQGVSELAYTDTNFFFLGYNLNAETGAVHEIIIKLEGFWNDALDTIDARLNLNDSTNTFGILMDTD